VKQLLYDAGGMGRNKEIRKKIEGHQRMLAEHRDKIERELGTAEPRRELIAYWERRIQDVHQRIVLLEEKLRKH